jgi:hypothetical protein
VKFPRRSELPADISTWNIRGKEFVFKPTLDPAWTFDTPIRQLTTAATSGKGSKCVFGASLAINL